MLNDLAQEIWEKKYKATTDVSFEDTCLRVANYIGQNENDDIKKNFYNILSTGKFFPGGRITNDANVNNYLMNCFCLHIDDSIDSIYETIKKVAMISKRGGGCGFNVSNIRPNGFPLSTGGTASGPVSWLRVFNTSCEAIKTAGSRRSALLSVLDVSHVDIEEYIVAKRKEGELTNFNISVGITDDFMRAVDNDANWNLVWDGKVYKTVKARELYHKICESAWLYNDPGFLFLDNINNKNDMLYAYYMLAVNPCGELALPAYIDSNGNLLEGSCCLGNINITNFISNAFSDDFKFNYNAYEKTIALAIRFLDDTLDVSKYPYESNRLIAQRERRIGLNHLSGIGTALAMMKIPYDSEEAKRFIRAISEFALKVSYETSIRLAKEKGSFPSLTQDYFNGGFFKTLPKNIQDDIKEYGLRNCSIGCIPPAGTGSLLMNNISNGIEPIFAREYERKIRQPDGSTITKLVEDPAWALYKRLGKPDGDNPEYFKTSMEISPQSHIHIQALVQQYIGSSISKTCNVPESFSLDDYKILIKSAWSLGIKGTTTFRAGTREGILTVKSDKPKETKTDAKIETASIKTIKRPRVLDGKIYQIPEHGGSKHTYCTISHIDDKGSKRPWEIFLSSSGDNSEWLAAIGRLASRLMRKTGDTIGVIEELREIGGQNGYLTKEYGYVQSVVQHISFILEEYVNSISDKEDHKVVKLVCPECGEIEYVKEGGCGKCLACSYTSCG